MNINVQTQAVLLLTAYFSKPMKDDPRPLTPTEWGRFALWLKEREISPGDLLTDDPAKLLAGWSDGKVTLERIRHLLGRAGAFGLALEKWQRAGLWVLTRSDADYPARLKRHLKTDSPPVLFGCGNRNLLNRGGISVIGSRDASADDLAFTTGIGEAAAQQGLSIVSGGARGVDETAMQGALECEGTAVGVLSDSLLRSATSAKYRKALLANNLVLISSFYPEAGFDVGNAMARNKYIYCLSDAAVVISSSRGKGGTWNGAIENLKNRWVPLWVKPAQDKNSGNAELVRQGARWLPSGKLDLAALSAKGASGEVEAAGSLPAESREENSDLFSFAYSESATKSGHIREAQAELKSELPPDGNVISGEESSFYNLFLGRLSALTASAPATVEDLLGHLDVNKSQLNDWLKRALNEGEVEKLSKPVRYRKVK
jgi:predicted Rossmann fold nucleotide-binding protein DprA/Smf involved in DNA uptake